MKVFRWIINIVLIAVGLAIAGFVAWLLFKFAGWLGIRK